LLFLTGIVICLIRYTSHCILNNNINQPTIMDKLKRPCVIIHSVSFLKNLGLLFLTTLLIQGCKTKSTEYSQGIGIYPGCTQESYAPVLIVDDSNYRNLAFHRPAYHSSSYDYNHTAQLVTDGIIDTINPIWFEVRTSQHGIVSKQERGNLFDRHMMSGIRIDGPKGWMSVKLSDKNAFEAIDSLLISGSLLVDDTKPKGWKFIVAGSDNGKEWEEIKTFSGNGYPGDSLPKRWRIWLPSNMRIFHETVKLNKEWHFTHYKLEAIFPGAISWNFVDFGLIGIHGRLKIGGPYSFTSAWKSAGRSSEWIYLDLGAKCRFDSLSLHWINPASYAVLEVSDDAIRWKTIESVSDNEDCINNLKLKQETQGRYIRLSMEKPVRNKEYILSEFQVFGTGGPVAIPRPNPDIDERGKLFLSGGNWKIQRASLVKAKGIDLSKPGYDDSDWIVATVPATVLMSYYNVGALPDPNFADNQLMISESFFYSDFWYRNEFIAPKSYTKKFIFLNFDGINWKAEVYLNGKNIGTIEGAFIRGKFDVSEYIIPGKNNTLAVRIMKNDTPGYAKEQTKESPGVNGGEIGADNPTFHASIGWDWMPTIRGRNIGIWNDVYLNATGPVTIENPYISFNLPLPDITSAEVRLELTLKNHGIDPAKGILTADIGPLHIEQKTEIESNSIKTIVLDPLIYPELNWKNPVLWWPAGYGNPHLYDARIEFITSDDQLSDSKTFKTGVREMDYSEEDGILKIMINGRRFSGRGGNWGFSESNLRYRAREYDIAVRYHRDMNFTMIRNWVGQTGNEEFYEACDRYGIMVWQDFWLANPVDGPNPDNNEMFLANAKDHLFKLRNHPSMALYCGRNEGFPPEVLDTALQNLVNKYHPDLHYISHSSEGVVSGYGPYRAMPIEYYFKERALPKIHSEMGMPNIVNFESLRQMMPDSALWPQGRMWGVHDFCLNGAQHAASFKEQLEKAFGPIDNIREWVKLAQWLNYRGYRAMFEAQSKYRMGLQLWMSHLAWPSLVWQTYDYYFDPSAAYFGCKKGSEPLHIQWNALTDSIEVVNTSYRKGEGLTARIEILNLDGSLKYKKELKLDSPEDSRVLCSRHPYPEGLSEVYFLRLKLLKDDNVLSENLYWRTLENNNLKTLRDLPAVPLELSSTIDLYNNTWYITTTLKNKSEYPALMARVKVVGDRSGERILPVLFSDNYLTIMPGEEAKVAMEFYEADTRGEKPVVLVEGLNIKKL